MTDLPVRYPLRLCLSSAALRPSFVFFSFFQQPVKWRLRNSGRGWNRSTSELLDNSLAFPQSTRIKLMTRTASYAAARAKAPLAPFEINRREPGPQDVVIDIQFCGVCHSDIHQVRDEWGGAIFPMVPGHEIVGTVSAVGGDVKKVKAGDLAGVGCFVDSCRTCANCKKGEE